MNNNFGKLTRLFRNNQIDINACLDNVNRVYRPLSPAIYLYNKLITYHGDKFNRDFIELVYVTLDAWNMNSRGAKLLEFGKFENSILDNKNLLLKLKKFNIRNIELAFDDLHELFNKLKLVETKAPLVTFTKTLHFMLPELVVPIDRKYTLSFFGINNYQLNNNSYMVFEGIHRGFCEFANKVAETGNDLIWYANNARKGNSAMTWLTSEAKIIDNIVIGYQKLYSKCI